jgi:hypothetical protein
MRGGRGDAAFAGGHGGRSTPGRGRGDMTDSLGRGLAPFVDWRDHPERHSSGKPNELADTASSPIKSMEVQMTEAENATKRRLGFEGGAPPPNGALAIMNSNMQLDGVLANDGENF